jgi:hypothetical protein
MFGTEVWNVCGSTSMRPRESALMPIVSSPRLPTLPLRPAA